MAITLAIFLCNVSIDPPDHEAMGVREDLTVNEIESIIELVLEEAFGIENYIPEGDDADQEFNYQFGSFVFKPDGVGLVSSQALVPILDITHFHFPQDDLEEGVHGILSPPPKLA